METYFLKAVLETLMQHATDQSQQNAHKPIPFSFDDAEMQGKNYFSKREKRLAGGQPSPSLLCHQSMKAHCKDK